VSQKTGTTLCHIEIKEIEKRQSLRAAILFHTPNSGFKKELKMFVSEKKPEERLWSANKHSKMVNERGQVVIVSSNYAPVIRKIQSV